MSVDIGSTVEGTVVKLADYGAIVRLQSGKTGLIHISEIADTYVRDVRDHFKEHDRVRVKVLSINAKGRYELSTKHIEQPERSVQIAEKRKPASRPPEVVDLGPDAAYRPEHEPPPANFEDQFDRFLKDSQERLLDLKRNLDSKRGFRRR